MHVTASITHLLHSGQTENIPRAYCAVYVRSILTQKLFRVEVKKILNNTNIVFLSRKAKKTEKDSFLGAKYFQVKTEG